MGTAWKVYKDGRVTCSHHRRTVHCTWCGFPASFTLDDYRYCHDCRSRTVTTASRIAELGELIKGSLRPRSCWLSDRVTLLVHSRDSLTKAGTNEPHLLGRSEAVFQGSRLAHQTIWVRYGLPEEVCLTTLTHEYAHALLNHHGRSRLTETQREGFCEYLAGVVVREQLGHSKAAINHYDTEFSRSDLYGRGMRLVTEAVRRNGEATVIRAFLTGKIVELRLPSRDESP